MIRLKRIFFLRIGGKNLHLLKLIGAFVLFAALLMFFQAGAGMFNSWDALKAYPACIGGVQSQFDFEGCRTALYYNTGLFPSAGQAELSSRQVWFALLGPIAQVLFWAALFIFGIILYKTGRIILPIEEASNSFFSARLGAKRRKAGKRK
ncbi:MAG: hypothetical protein WC602_02490 [archaeon]